jgi:zinc D-Ala-D-Ala dipeptidase
MKKSKKILGVVLLFVVFLISCSQKEEPLVLVSALDSSIIIDMPYASKDNFVGQVLYDTTLCFLRKSVAERVVRVQQKLKNQNLGLKIWDGYRPQSVQYKMWEIVQDPQFVADPKKGSRHNRGAAVDVTLVDATGKELAMPTYFDDFTDKAHRNYSELSSVVIQNRKILTEVMKEEGFIPLASEWWHFDALNWESYSLLNISLKELGKMK